MKYPEVKLMLSVLKGGLTLLSMLFGVLKHFDSLWEVEIGMKAEVNKLHHLGIDDVIHRSTLAEANKCNPQSSLQTFMHTS